MAAPDPELASNPSNLPAADVAVPIQRVAAAVQYIESHLSEAPDLDTIAFQSTYSRFHFQRLFHAAVGYPVFEYIRRRRLSEAARRLLNSQSDKIIDVALDLGFGSPEAFSRSFRQSFGVSPAAFRTAGGGQRFGLVAACTPESLAHLQRLGAPALDYRIVRHPAVRIHCAAMRESGTQPEDQARLLAAWQTALAAANLKPERAADRAALERQPCVGVIQYAPVYGADVQFRYAPGRLANHLSADGRPASLESTAKPTGGSDSNAQPTGGSDSNAQPTGGFADHSLDLPAGDVLRVTHRGSVRNFAHSFFYIYGPLMQAIGRTAHPEIHCDLAVYGAGFRAPDDPDNRIELWIPLAK